MDENQLLIRHAARWAQDRSRTLDTDLLEVALSLRSVHDGLAANRWPTRSVEHLMLVRWPSHGPQGAPDVPALVATLDSFWRFLRTTGRMAGASAEPGDLLREAKAAARKMPAACADKSNWGHSKQLVGFGEGLGISLDGVADLDELNARMQQISDAWNAQPDEVRRSRLPSVGHAGSRMGRALEDAAAAFQRTGELPSDWKLPEPPRLDDDDADEPLFPNDPEVSAPQVRSCGFVRKVLELAEWVGSGRETTATGVLRPAIAREAYDALDLQSWEWEWARAGGMSNPDTPEAQAIFARTYQVWRSAAECLPLDRLWQAALTMGLITVAGKRASANPAAIPASAFDWVSLGHGLLFTLTHRAHRHLAFEPLSGILLMISAKYGEPSTVDELREWWWNSPKNDLAEILHEYEVGRRLSDRTVDRCLAMFSDCGLWTTRHGHLVGTEFGWDFTLILIGALEQGLFED